MLILFKKYLHLKHFNLLILINITSLNEFEKKKLVFNQNNYRFKRINILSI